MKVAAVIPARFNSSRLPGKPLMLIGDKPMIWHVYERVRSCSVIDEVCVATDDDRIAATCRAFGIPYATTEATHKSGTDRVAECSRFLKADVFVNVQGDEPFIDPLSIRMVVDGLLSNSSNGVVVANGYTKLVNPIEIEGKDVVKVIVSGDSFAMAYSRLPIPFSRNGSAAYHKQLGLYAFLPPALDFYLSSPQGMVEQSESVEMYRFLERGVRVLMIEVPDNGISVDTLSDLESARLIYSRL